MKPGDEYPPPWVDQAARGICAEISYAAIKGMVANGEDHGDPRLFLLRCSQVLAAVRHWTERAGIS
jgi:hypothetical protein